MLSPAVSEKWAQHYTPKARMARTVRDEILLSYLTGLGPVGEPVCCMAKWLSKDMGWDQQTYYLSINNLIRSGRVRRFYCGQYIVLKPLEPGRSALSRKLEAAE